MRLFTATLLASLLAGAASAAPAPAGPIQAPASQLAPAPQVQQVGTP